MPFFWSQSFATRIDFNFSCLISFEQKSANERLADGLLQDFALQNRQKEGL
jgi:hypothetical protein